MQSIQRLKQNHYKPKNFLIRVIDSSSLNNKRHRSRQPSRTYLTYAFSIPSKTASGSSLMIFSDKILKAIFCKKQIRRWKNQKTILLTREPRSRAHDSRKVTIQDETLNADNNFRKVGQYEFQIREFKVLSERDNVFKMPLDIFQNKDSGENTPNRNKIYEFCSFFCLNNSKFLPNRLSNFRFEQTFFESIFNYVQGNKLL